MAGRSVESKNRFGAAGAATSLNAARPWVAFGPLWHGLVLAVFVIRFFLPTESAAQGDTLWIVALWMMCGLIWLLGAVRAAKRGLRVGWLETALALWIGGQLMSAIFIVATTGDKRAAVNVAWEWFGLGIVWLVVRHGCEDRSFRSGLVRSMIVTGAVLGGLGLWQHYVSQPELVAEYGPLFDRLREADASEAASIKFQLGRAGIPTEDPALTLFEKRLRDSREPMGLFALANTFGGCLAAWLVLTLGEILAVSRRGLRWRVLIPLLMCACVIGWCLLLTKSRTAWIGALCGIAVLVATSFRSTLWKRLLLFGGLCVAAVGVVLGLLVQFGGLDQQVISEAPKSLSYRFQYWQATRQMITDHVWLGVGPGNFRQHYLKYKLPSASEEIADPHNLFFDVASSGGMVSLTGLILFLALVVVTQRRRSAGNANSNSRVAIAESPSSLSTLPFWCSGIGVLLAFLGSLLFSGPWEDRLLILTAVWAAVAGCLSRSHRDASLVDAGETSETNQMALAACTALVVHLLGAGGIAMPAVSQLLLALAALSLVGSSHAPGATGGNHQISHKVSLLAAFGLGLAFIVFAVSALVPVMRSHAWEHAAEVALFTRGLAGREVADKYYREAALSDPWSAQPWRLRFELIEDGSPSRSNESHEVAVMLLKEAMTRDPLNFWGPRAMGMLWMARWTATSNREDASEAAEWLRRAAELYPTNASLRAELSLALERSQRHSAAVDAAGQALRQDEIYRKFGHVDRYLSESVKTRLQRLINETTP